MSNYRRLFQPGGTFVFTVVTHKRRGFLCEPYARHCLRAAIERTRGDRPFEALAFVLPPIHFHCIWKLPEGDDDFSNRMACIKKDFTKSWLAGGGMRSAFQGQGGTGVNEVSGVGDSGSIRSEMKMIWPVT